MIISNMCILLSFASIAAKISFHDPGKKGGWYQFQYLERWWAENSSQGLCRCLAQQNEWMKQIGIWWRWISHGTLCPCNDVNLLFSCTSCKALEQRTCLTQCTKCNYLRSCWGHLEDVTRAYRSYQPLSLQRFPHWYELVFIYLFIYSFMDTSSVHFVNCFSFSQASFYL